MKMRSALWGLCVSWWVACSLQMAAAQNCDFRSPADASQALSTLLREYIAGQDEAVDIVTAKVVGWERTTPLVLVFTGPTRVGKTLTANLVANALLPTLQDKSLTNKPGLVELSAQQLAGYLNQVEEAGGYAKASKKIEDALQRRLAQTLKACNGNAVVILDEMLPAAGTSFPVDYFRMFQFLDNIIDASRHSFVYEGDTYDTSRTVFLLISPLHVKSMLRMIPSVKSPTEEFAWFGAFRQKVVDRVQEQWGDILKLHQRAQGIVPFLPITAETAREVFVKRLRLATRTWTQRDLRVHTEDSIGIDAQMYLEELATPRSDGPKVILKVIPPSEELSRFLAAVGTSRIFLKYSDGRGKHLHGPDCLPLSALPLEDMILVSGSQIIKAGLPSHLRDTVVKQLAGMKDVLQREFLQKTMSINRAGSEGYVGKPTQLRIQVRFEASCKDGQLSLASFADIYVIAMRETSAWFSDTMLPSSVRPDSTKLLGKKSINVNTQPLPTEKLLCGLAINSLERFEKAWGPYKRVHVDAYNQLHAQLKTWRMERPLIIALAGQTGSLSAGDGVTPISQLVLAFVESVQKQRVLLQFDFASPADNIVASRKTSFAAAHDDCEGQVVVLVSNVPLRGPNGTDAAKVQFLSTLFNSKKKYFEFQGKLLSTSQMVVIIDMPDDSGSKLDDDPSYRLLSDGSATLLATTRTQAKQSLSSFIHDPSAAVIGVLQSQQGQQVKVADANPDVEVYDNEIQVGAEYSSFAVAGLLASGCIMILLILASAQAIMDRSRAKPSAGPTAATAVVGLSQSEPGQDATSSSQNDNRGTKVVPTILSCNGDVATPLTQTSALGAGEDPISDQLDAVNPTSTTPTLEVGKLSPSAATPPTVDAPAPSSSTAPIVGYASAILPVIEPFDKGAHPQHLADMPAKHNQPMEPESQLVPVHPLTSVEAQEKSAPSTVLAFEPLIAAGSESPHQLSPADRASGVTEGAGAP